MTEAELLEAIWQSPGDDRPRLVYADWLQERGDPRGEFIHLQCNSKRSAELGERERLLERQHASEWSEPFKKLGVRVVVFRRGLPDFLAADAKVFAEHGAMLLRLAPITRLSLMTLPNFLSLKPLFELPEFARITDLSLANLVGGDEAALELAAAPNARNLRGLNMWKTGLTAVGIEALANSPYLTQLADLVVGGQRIGREGFAALARSKLRALHHVSFHECGLTGNDWAALGDAPAFAQVKSLLLSGNSMGDEAALALSRARTLHALEELDLKRQGLSEKAIVALANWPGMKAVRKLSLAENSIGPDGGEAIARSPMLSGLLHLDLSGNSLRARGGRAIAESTALGSLVSLDIRNNELQVEGVTAFVEGRGLPALRELRISQNGIYTGTYTEHSDWDGTVVASSADQEGAQETKARFVSKPQLVVY
jgi:uncharacterized protein (TIGR02996 family)